MDCILRKGRTEHVTLLTHADKVKKLEEFLGSKRHRIDLFLPEDVFYGTTVGPDDPERMADQIFKWLGVKHRSLVLHIDSNQETLMSYEHTKAGSRVVLGWRCQEDVLLCGAVVAHAVVHHLLIARARISFGSHEEDESITDLATIHAGLGVLILNSFGKQPVLGMMGRINYASEFLDYCNQHQLVSSLWQPYVMPDTATQYLSAKSKAGILKPFIVRSIKRTRSQKWIVTASVSCFVLITGVGAIIVSNQPARLSAEMLEKRDSISVLKAQVEQCQETVNRKEATWDRSDIFIQRKIEADETRCASLRSRYNYEVGQYNADL